MSRLSIRTLALIAAASLSASAWSAPEHLSARQIEHRGKMLAKQAQQRAKGDVTAMYNLDVKAPELKRFVLGKSQVVITNGASGRLTVDLFAVDNVVGVQRAEITVSSADGMYYQIGSASVSYPQGRATLSVPVSFWTDAESGEWSLSSVTLTDANDNSRYYDASALAAMGSTSFQVVNRLRTDGIAPELTGGAILTPTVSRSTPPRGEYPTNPARVGLTLSATDAGQTKISGLSYAYANVCSESGWPCLYLSGSAERQGHPSGKFVLGAQVSRYEDLGRYVVESVELHDAQGNTRYIYRWDTDFDALFGGDASITITE